MKEYFTNKKKELVEQKAKLEAVDYSEQVAKEVDDFKVVKAKEIEDFEVATKNKYDVIKQKDIDKVDCYIEFVDTELDKIVKKELEEQATDTMPVEESVQEGV